MRAAVNNKRKLAVPDIEVEITDLETNITTTYESIGKAAKAFASNIKPILPREKKKKKKKKKKK